MKARYILISLLNNIVFALLALYVAITGAFAASVMSINDISIEPKVIEHEIKTGQKVKGSIKVSNNSDRWLKLYVKNENRVLFAGQKENRNYLKIFPQKFTLNPGETELIKYTFKAPKNVSGETFMTISICEPEKIDRENTTIEVHQGIGMYVKLKGTEKVSAKIGDMGISTEGRKTGVYVQLKNDGNVSVRPRGKIFITGKTNFIKQEIDIKYGAPIYPGNTRTINIALDEDKVIPGEYELNAVINCGIGDKPELMKRKTEVKIE